MNAQKPPAKRYVAYKKGEPWLQDKADPMEARIVAGKPIFQEGQNPKATLSSMDIVKNPKDPGGMDFRDEITPASSSASTTP
jgi:hypothetical protein